ncbi:sigma-54 dependent transcriptional regulator [bacterium]|nr:sigma-54 dependent transcriptional regulator [bacterium]
MKHVWILDRSHEYAEELLAALPPHIYETKIWRDGEAMLAALDGEAPDLIVLEHGVEKPAGIVVVRGVKKHDRRLPVVVVASQTSTKGAIESMREGAYDYLPRETLPAGLEDAARRALSGEGGLIQTIGSPGPGDVEEFGAIVGRTPEMIEIHKLIGQVATTGVPVLIQGERGTGKELVARALHYNSDRREGPFITVNCAAVSPASLDLELFGDSRGDAKASDERGGGGQRELGRLEMADGGTIFLDELDAMSLEAQARVLTVLEEGSFERPGSRRKARVDVRVVAAAGRSLVAKMKDGSFRVDLFYRLKVVSVFMPSLRDRREDIPHLAEHFVRRAGLKMHREIDGISPAAVELLQAYPWPGNVRELEQSIQGAVAFNRSGVLVADDFEILREGHETWPSVASGTGGTIGAAVRGEFDRRSAAGEEAIARPVIAEVERGLVEAALEACSGNQVRAAKMLGISRNTLRKRMTETSR